MPFHQDPPTLANQYRADRALREHLERLLPDAVLREVEPTLDTLGEDAVGPLWALAEQAEAEPPRLVPYDPWGRRVDRIETSSAWRALHERQVDLGLCALPYSGRYGDHARVVQHAFVHLYAPSSATYTCPVAMTDAAVRVLVDHAPRRLRDRVVARLTSRDAAVAWTSGQWMTEREGGSDVGLTATVARSGDDGRWTLHGTKWFTSATTADCALALARPGSAAAGGSRGLGLFLVELVDPVTGEPQVGRTILVNRLKDKLGTRSLPTAELTLDGAVATPVSLTDGLRTISGMLNVTRAHNAMNAAAGMRRAYALAAAYAHGRSAFGRRLIDLPLHRETLADLAVDAEGAFALTLRVMQLMGRVESGTADEREVRVLRGLLPVAKLLTGKDAVAQASEALECFGGAGYIEDTGLPALLRNAQVLPIWEGTTNVLSLDLLRAHERAKAVEAVLDELRDGELEGAGGDGGGPRGALAGVRGAVVAEEKALRDEAGRLDLLDAAVVQAGMRAFALRLGRLAAAAQLCEHAAHRLARHDDDRALHAAQRYVRRWGIGAARPGRVFDADRATEAGALLD